MSSGRFHRRFRLLLACLLVSASARVAWAHIRLDRSSPGRDEVVSTMPPQLRLEFSGTIESRYTSLTMTAPDGSSVPIGEVVFVDGSDRVITSRLPQLTTPGTYTVGWRTAGADGHVLEGSYSFTLAADSAASGVHDSVDAAAAPAPQDAHEHHGHEEPESVGGSADAIGRGLHFLALLLLTGAITFRSVLLPRLDLADDVGTVLRRRSWHLLTGAALLLAAVAVLRLWLQSTALHGAERAWDGGLLSIMLRDTSWGRAWVLQVFLFAVLGAAIVWARPARDAIASRVALVAVAGLCAIPALSGHAAGAEGAGWLVVANDTLHVFAAGGWIGTLALLLLALPRIAGSAEGSRRAANAVDTFSPLALVAAAVVLLSGLVNTIVHLTRVDQLWTTDYGRTLVVKLVLVAVVLLMGFINWRVVRPRLHASDAGPGRLRLTASTELLFAALVVAATAVLTGQPRP